MKNIKFRPAGVCCREMNFVLNDDNKIVNVEFIGGCPGNTLGIRSLAIGLDAKEIADKLENVSCGGRSTSCPAQFSMALREALK
ncbi:TIGR03905 family TSCPD domain-containing protein [Sinanaerobacter chloroacetimidivorans]|uniref:ribonucleoside-diphosphate reductase n=1 Tax=Sinanaerobacter chloroacetimidivorans TaxID=2818044 RepID=A0A8J8B2X4_9FIRM|nr:TIGR03905 family TSCPD domain-containing protein [Sinanaerobacter chloroacetimidivorans]MBR0600293.1 TIGR03905 family TSCPD domain-containing protein [Sinanaerobacter chloroacetimidivorans]